jgi:DNA replication protein DnaC
MNDHGTLEKMTQLRLGGMARAFRAVLETGIGANFTADELIAHLIDAEWDERHNRKLARLLKNARLRYQASFEQIDFGAHRNLDKNLILRLSDGGWIERHQNVIVSGPTGIGKSFLGCALGHQACLLGHRVLYFNCTKFFPRLKLWKADGSYPREIARIEKAAVAIFDDFGLERLDSQSRLSLLEILEDRAGHRSTVIATQLPVEQWFDVIGDPTIADAICDRLIHTALRIEMKGDSMRRNDRQEH